MIRFGLLILLISGFAANAKVHFRSTFERGIASTAKEIAPGQKRISLLPGESIGDWPLNGGSGVVEFNFPAARDTFHYTQRQGSLLKGVTGIRKFHPKWVSIRTTGLGEWGSDPRALERNSKGMIRLDSEKTLCGAFCARVNCRVDSQVLISKSIPEIRGKRMHCRFYIAFSAGLLGKDEYHSLPVFFGVFGRISTPRLFPLKKPREEHTHLTFLDSPSGRVSERNPSSSLVPLLPDSIYCVEVAFEEKDSARLSSRMWVNGYLQGEVISQHTPYEKRFYSITLGKTSIPRRDGVIWLDDIVISDTAIGTRPEKPSLAMENGDVVGTPFLDRDPEAWHQASQWQVSRINSWLLPALNTGRDSIHKTRLPHPQYVLLSDSLNLQMHFPEPQIVPTGIPAGDTCLVRVRYQSEKGYWSDWSRPHGFAMPDLPEGGEIRLPEINEVWFTRPGGLRKLESLQRGKWVDLHFRYTLPKSTKPYSMAFMDIYMTGDPANYLGNYRNRGDVFRARNSYVMSLSFPSKVIYAREKENSFSATELYTKKGLYFDDSLGRHDQDLTRGTARLRVRVLDQAVPGPWSLVAFIKEENTGVSRMYRRLFLVQGDDAPKSLAWVWVTIVMACTGIMVAKRHFNQRKKATHEEEPQDPKDKVVLEFDSPYDERIRSAKDYILENFQKPISPRDVADAIGVSPNWLSKFFKRGTGKNVVKYMNEIRIEEAKQLLRDTKLSVNEIAFRVGFNTLVNFNRTFKRLAGKSPMAYRSDP